MNVNPMNAFSQGMAEEMQQMPAFRKFTGGNAEDMKRRLFSPSQRSPMMGQVEQFLYQNRPQQVMDAQMEARGNQYPPMQMQGLEGLQGNRMPSQVMAESAFEQYSGAAQPRPMQQPQSQQPMQQAPQQRVLSQDQRRKYNEMRRSGGADAAKSFRDKVKARKGM